MFEVVLFVMENTTDIVPSNWCFIDDEKLMSYWPSANTDTMKIKRLVVNKANPSSNWSKHLIRRLTTEPTDTYDKARHELNLAQFTSDLSSGEGEEIKSKRRRYRNPKFRVSDSDSDENMDPNIKMKKGL